MKAQWRRVAGLLAMLFAANATALMAQHPVDGQEFMFSNLRARGQPVIPIFDGWYVNPDGTYNLCFGYFNLNLEDTVDIPVGPDNLVEPARFDGRQPTHFLPVPPPPNLFRRYFCTFTVNVPADFGTARVVWTLREDGRTYSVPGHLGSPSYQLEELIQISRGSVAPTVRFEPRGPEGRGRSGNLRLGPLATTVGKPLSLTITVTWPKDVVRTGVTDDDDGGRGQEPSGRQRVWWAKWAKHQGPGRVTFSASDINVYEGEETVATTVTFSEPGRYLLRVQAIDNPREGGSFQFHCCWTNGYVEVNVAR